MNKRRWAIRLCHVVYEQKKTEKITFPKVPYLMNKISISKNSKWWWWWSSSYNHHRFRFEIIIHDNNHNNNNNKTNETCDLNLFFLWIPIWSNLFFSHYPVYSMILFRDDNHHVKEMIQKSKRFTNFTDKRLRLGFSHK